MSMKPNIAAEAELAKGRIVNSKVDDDTKRNFIALINTSTMATNGISPEEKILSLTECMAHLSFSLTSFLERTESRIDLLETTYMKEFPADKSERIAAKEKELQLIEQYRNVMGIEPGIKIDGMSIHDVHTKLLNSETTSETEFSFMALASKIGEILKTPMPWVFASIAVCSPYAVGIIKTIIDAFH